MAMCQMITFIVSKYLRFHYVTIAPPPPSPYEKIQPLFSSNRPLKVEVLSSLPFSKFGWRLNPPRPCRKDEAGGAHYVKLRLTN